MKTLTDYVWEERKGSIYVSEHAGAFVTGPFSSKEQAKVFFRNEMDLELVEPSVEQPASGVTPQE